MNPNHFVVSFIFVLVLADLTALVRLFLLFRGARGRKWWRAWLMFWMLGATGFCVAIMFEGILLGSTHNPVPESLVSMQFIWHFLILPVVLIVLFVEFVVGMFRNLMRSRKSKEVPVSAESEPVPEPVTRYSRRQFLASATMVAAPLTTMGLAGTGLSQIGKFRVRTFDVAVNGLPAALDNYSMTVIADVHVGVYSTPKMLSDIVEVSNQLRSNLVLLPGDLINIAHADLPGALDMVSKLDSRDGVYLIQGNHDVVQAPDEFNEMVRRRGVKILVDEGEIITAREERFQLLGTRWLEYEEDRDRSVAYTAGLREPGMFVMMMAHHPHSWDVAARCGIPLVISGHTHGGQIMLSKNIGLGPLRFRYLSGQYETEGSTLIVSNGVGNWFPFRYGAPAEILRVNLHPKLV